MGSSSNPSIPRTSFTQTEFSRNVSAGLQTFLSNGRVEIDSNKVENLVRPIALNRKNALFAGHDEGGRAWGRIASLIETCKINGVEPFAYLKSTREAIAAAIRKTTSTTYSLGTSSRQAERKVLSRQRLRTKYDVNLELETALYR